MPDSSPRDLCEYLDWDSDFFGLRIAKYRERRMTPEAANLILDWSRQSRIDCLYFLADSADPVTVRTAENAGFHLADVRVTLSRTIGDDTRSDLAGDIRTAEQRDLLALSAIARTSHRDTRFYFDRMFPRERCDDLYAAWIERSCGGFADSVLVAATAGTVHGYITCHLSTGGEGSIGLLAVRESSRGRGYGRHMVQAALDFLRREGMNRAVVVTQGRNISSQRLYESCGFRTQLQQLWYHRWFTPEEGTPAT